ncbi:A-agglutinin anchorage subunit [Hyalella azteca]|uniref:A-agglutinin anchorage subunit n=1 Tax=Hyalella azteca TaxID=294128 RepID=A0A8B7PPT5_HYAAZ|nr:A-agglutinin anchorage subunit [Hyalella azteca]
MPGMPPLPLPACTSPKVCSAGACVDGISDPNNPAAVCASNGASTTQFYSLKPACTSAVLCLGTNVAFIYNCTSGHYFNQILNSCKSLPVNHCEGVTTDGISASLTNCSNGVVCQGGAFVTEIQCGTGQVFNISQNGCIVRPASPKCPPMDGCTFASSGSLTTTRPPGQSSSTTTRPPGQSSSTTTRPPGQSSATSGSGSTSTTTPPTSSSTTTTKPAGCSASNVNKRYPHESKCERYYTCRLISGIYKYVELICSGTTVYNPTTGYCEPPTTTPSCRKSRSDAA